MGNDWWVLPVTVCVIGIMILCFVAGARVGTSSVYKTCLSKNGHMVYNDAIKYCSEYTR